MTNEAIRPWCAVAIYPGRQEFVLGTIILPADTSYHEVEKALIAHASTFLPDGFRIIKPICGALFFTGTGEDQ